LPGTAWDTDEPLSRLRGGSPFEATERKAG